MVSDYFFVTQKMTDEKKAALVASRISELKDYIWQSLMDSNEFNLQCISANFFWYHLVEDWHQKNRVKIDSYDWKYLLYLSLKDHGIYVSYADGTLSIMQKYS